jgi:copper chaperone
MEKRFKTNIKCGGCIAQVGPKLNEALGEGNWQVDLESAEKWLKVKEADASKAKKTVEEAGYTAQEA